MPVPSGVLPFLIVIQAYLAFAGLEGLLDSPAATGGPGQVGEGYSIGPVCQVVGDVGRVVEAASGQDPVLGVGVACTVDASPSPGGAAITYEPLPAERVRHAVAGRAAISSSARRSPPAVRRSPFGILAVVLAMTR